MRISHTLTLLALAVTLAACGGSTSSGSFSPRGDSAGDTDTGGNTDTGGGGNTDTGGGGNTDTGGGGNPGTGGTADTAPRIVNFKRAGVTLDTLEPNTASCATNVRLDGGRSYQVTLPSSSGKVISFQVIEPKAINCMKGNPLVLQGHGFGGARTENPAAGSFIERLQDNGYAVISIDQRGFNDSTGTVRTMDPDFEGQDLLQIMDWAEKNLDYLAYDRPSKSAEYNLASGATGGSYGGMYQMLIHNIDTKNRLDVLTPDITPHDLRASLYPGRVIKSAWISLLVVGGEAGANQPLIAGLDPVTKETLVRGLSTNEISTPALNFFYYHSVKYFGAPDDTDISDMNFLTSMLAMSPIKPIYVGAAKPAPKPVDILFSQGLRDTLFNFNEGWLNYQAYKALGGDVRFMTHESGHILPGLQSPSGKNNCGALSRDDADLAFLNEKLRPPQQQAATAATAAALAQLKTKVCLSLNNGSAGVPGDAVYVDPALITTLSEAITIPPSTIPVPNAALGPTSVLQPTFIPLNGLVGPLTLGGIGKLTVKLNNVLAPLNGCAVVVSPAGVPSSPISACDAIVLVGFGARTGTATPRLIDEQMQPIRGLGDHIVAMVGVAEKLVEGEQLGLMVYGYNQQYFSSISRDLLVPAVTITGTVEVPLLP
ncbi:MAG: CocE/NonD family hydrolase [Paraperlucidibaca sp.]